MDNSDSYLPALIIICAVYVALLLIMATAKDADETTSGKIATFFLLSSWPLALVLILIRGIDAYFSRKNGAINPDG